MHYFASGYHFDIYLFVQVALFWKCWKRIQLLTILYYPPSPSGKRYRPVQDNAAHLYHQYIGSILQESRDQTTVMFTPRGNETLVKTKIDLQYIILVAFEYPVKTS